MTALAVMLMVVAILLIWGGLVGSIIALRMVDPPYAESVLEKQRLEQVEEASDSVA